MNKNTFDCIVLGNQTEGFLLIQKLFETSQALNQPLRLAHIKSPGPLEKRILPNAILKYYQMIGHASPANVQIRTQRFVQPWNSVILSQYLPSTHVNSLLTEFFAAGDGSLLRSFCDTLPLKNKTLLYDVGKLLSPHLSHQLGQTLESYVLSAILYSEVSSWTPQLPEIIETRRYQNWGKTVIKEVLGEGFEIFLEGESEPLYTKKIVFNLRRDQYQQVYFSPAKLKSLLIEGLPPLSKFRNLYHVGLKLDRHQLNFTPEFLEIFVPQSEMSLCEEVYVTQNDSHGWHLILDSPSVVDPQFLGASVNAAKKDLAFWFPRLNEVWKGSDIPCEMAWAVEQKLNISPQFMLSDFSYENWTHPLNKKNVFMIPTWSRSYLPYPVGFISHLDRLVHLILKSGKKHEKTPLPSLLNRN